MRKVSEGLNVEYARRYWAPQIKAGVVVDDNGVFTVVKCLTPTGTNADGETTFCADTTAENDMHCASCAKHFSVETHITRSMTTEGGW